MIRRSHLLAAALVAAMPLAALASPVAHDPPPAATATGPCDLTVDFVSDLKGALETCGCHAANWGGVSRRKAFLNKALAQPGHRVVVVGGDFLPMPGGFVEDAKAEAMTRALHLLPLDAVTLGDYDFSPGTERLMKEVQGLPLVTTNIVWSDTRKEVGVPMIVKTYKGLPSQNLPDKEIRVAILSFMDAKLQKTIDFYLEDDKRKVTILDPAAAAATWIPRALAAADFVVALVHMEPGPAGEFAKANPGINVVVAGHTAGEMITVPFHAGTSWVVANSDRGRYIGELRFNFNANLLASDPVPQQIPVDETLGGDPALDAVVADYRVVVREDSIATAKKAAAEANPAH